MRLIDADALLKGKTDHEMISTHLIYNAPTVGEHTREMVGIWILRDLFRCECSSCGCIIERESNYCPRCGARFVRRQSNETD